MEIDKYLRAFVETDMNQIVICDTNHIIVYMNKVAIEKFSDLGGADLIGKSLMQYLGVETQSRIEAIVSWFSESPDNNWVYTYRNEASQTDMYAVALRDENGNLIGYYEKRRSTFPETEELYHMD
ncbi:MAG: PAS domain-containing protein [Ruminococcus sp.]|jgi:transcriptional regulator with PAS, ATPase and Fis domain|nr:PAS domain-containing protein [Ruminococcus sp.]